MVLSFIGLYPPGICLGLVWPGLIGKEVISLKSLYCLQVGTLTRSFYLDSYLSLPQLLLSFYWTKPPARNIPTNLIHIWLIKWFFRSLTWKTVWERKEDSFLTGSVYVRKTRMFFFFLLSEIQLSLAFLVIFYWSVTWSK